MTTAIQHQVKIGPDFFKKELREYSDWKWALVREAAQNCLDAPDSDTVHFNIGFASDDNGDNTYFEFVNNGDPMDKDTLFNKLLTLGESGKNFQGSVGGFGKAKTVLYFSHVSYRIHTGSLLVEGCGGNFNVTEDVEYFHGTRSRVIINGDITQDLIDNVKRFVALAQWQGTVYLNGDEYRCEMRKGTPRREFDFGKIYTNKSCENLFVVRVGGIPMFTQRVALNRCVILELAGSSLNTLTSNRDGLTNAIRWQVEQFITDLAVDKRKALKKDIKPKYRRFVGDRFNEVTRESVGLSFDTSALVAAFTATTSVSDDSTSVGFLESATAMSVMEDEYRSQLDQMFIIKNETELMVPNYYVPTSPEFGTYAKKLAVIWGKLMLTMHRLFENKEPFSIGFIFAEPEVGDDAVTNDVTAAEFEDSNTYGKVFYLNPVCVVKQQNSESRSFKKRFLLTERNKLITYACHEFVHGSGFSGHNDDYAYAFTDSMIKVLDNRQKFNWCFQ